MTRHAALSIALVSLGLAGVGLTAGCSRSQEPPPPALGDTLETIGLVPSFRLQLDPGGSGRLYSGGSVSDDGGRTWRSLTGADGRGVALLGARQAVPFALGPNGRLLLGEVLFEDAATAPGLGEFARAVEWSGSAWISHDPLPGGVPDGTSPELRVRGVGFLPGGAAAVAMQRSIRIAGTGEREAPGEVRAFLAASDGTLYVAIEGATQFPLYISQGGGEPWLPVGGVERVNAMAEGFDGTIYLAAQRFGRRRGGAIEWDPAGMRLTAVHLVAHPRAPIVAAWGGESTLIVSRDDGRSFAEVRWSDLRVAWVAFDPAQTESFLVVDRAGTLHRLSLGQAPAGSR